jgi:hypothetical protein
MALRFAILMTPRANVTVTTIGSPSGMAATAKLKQEQVLNTPNASRIWNFKSSRNHYMVNYLES